MIYCFDLDKTLCSGCGRDGEYTKAKPYKKRIDKVNELFDAGHTIIIDTARGALSKKDWTRLTAYQLKRWGVKHHQLRCGVKLFAHYYIDDKGISDKDFFT